MALVSNEKYALYFQKVGLLYKRPEIKASLEVILSIFTITILIFAAIRPTLTNIVSLQKKIEDQEAINKKADRKIAQLVAAQNQLKEFGSSLVLFDNAVPDSFSYSDSAKRLEYLARTNNLAIDSVSFSGSVLLSGGKISGDWAAKIARPSVDNLIIDQISFTVSGKPANILNFLKQVENMDRLAVLNNVSLTKQLGANKTEDILRASGKIDFYFYSEKL